MQSDSKKEIWLIPYAHLDTQWRWEYPTTIKKYIKNTLEQNFDRFAKFPTYVFNFTGAIRYAMMKDYYPEKFELAKKFIQEGRWNLSGTCLDETDTLSPSIESLVRNILYGDRWQKQEFGISSRDYMIPDCFGFPANLPSILAHCGLIGFSTQKLSWGSSVGIPFDLGVWNGPDGEGIVSALNAMNYTYHVIPPLHKDKKRIQTLYRTGEKNGVWKSFIYYGVGDIGGAPTSGSIRRALKSIEHAKDIAPDLVIKQGAATQFFKEITKEEREKLSTYQGDLLLINHSAGSLTSATIMKRWNRKNEQLAFSAESAALSAMLIAGSRYPEEKVKAAWFKVVGNQMHDILPGTCTPLAYTYSQNDEVIALKTWQAILEDAAHAIAPYVEGNGEFLIFNALPESRSDIVNLILPPHIQVSQEKSIFMVGSDGSRYSAQLYNESDGTKVLRFMPKLAPIGWSRFSLDTSSSTESEQKVSLESDGNGYKLENQYYIVSITKSGVINSIIPKSLNRNILKTPIAYEFQKEKPMAYPAWNMDWKDRKKSPYLRIEDGSVSVVEQGPIRCTLKISKKWNKSQFDRYVSLSDNSEVVEFTEKIWWHEKGCSFKLAINPAMTDPKATFNWETARAIRRVNSDRLFEMPSRYWVDLSEDTWGVSVVEDSKYGWDRPTADKLRLTLIYTPKVRKFMGFKDQATQDWGHHTIRFGIYVHEGNSSLHKTDFYARCLNQPVRTFYIEDTRANVKKQKISLFSIEDPSIGVSAVKKAEEGKGIVIRLYDRVGKSNESKITFYSEILEVVRVNGLEEPLEKIPHSGSSFVASVKANGIAAYLITLKQYPEPLFIPQKSVELNYDTQIMGKNHQLGGIFPAELIPNVINSGDVVFKIRSAVSTGSANLKDAMIANEQIIELSPDQHSISLLVTSESDSEYLFKWADYDNNIVKEDLVAVPSYSGFIGQWDTRSWLFKPLHHLRNARDYVWLNICTGVKAGYVKKGRLEFFTTHTHKSGKDMPYLHGYWFTIRLNKPNNAVKLVMPKKTHKNLYVIAATMSTEAFTTQSTQYLIDSYDF